MGRAAGSDVPGMECRGMNGEIFGNKSLAFAGYILVSPAAGVIISNVRKHQDNPEGLLNTDYWPCLLRF
jgi:hypothetical protein